MNELISPHKLFSRSSVLDKQCPVPKSRGLYAWFFKEIPPFVPTDGCIKKDKLSDWGIEEKDIDVGHPFCVNFGLDHAIEKGFEKILKARADGINLIADVSTFSNTLLKDKKILITQQTSIDRMEMGDLFMYGYTEFLKICWNINTWYPTKTGLTSLAKNFYNICKEDNWKSALINNTSFVDIFNLKWIDFRANWSVLKDMQEEMLQNKLVDFEKYLWGSKEQWHVWDKEGNLVYTHPNMGKITTEKDWHL